MCLNGGEKQWVGLWIKILASAKGISTWSKLCTFPGVAVTKYHGRGPYTTNIFLSPSSGGQFKIKVSDASTVSFFWEPWGKDLF